MGEVAMKVQVGLKMLGGRAAVFRWLCLGAGRQAVVWPMSLNSYRELEIEH